MARHTSERERRADDAERELVQWKKVRFMADKVGDEFDGYITGVSAFGLYVELVEHFVEGMVHVSTMADDYYRFVEKAHVLQGREHRQGLPARRPGAVQVVKVDMERRQIDLGLVEILDRVARVRSEPRPAPQQGASRDGDPPARRRGEGGPAAARKRASSGQGGQGTGRQAEAMSRRSVVIGTAGHIDHGKSALVRALTGTDPDRLKEEQARGITIDLGFAHTETDGIDAVVRRRARARTVRQEHAGRAPAGSISSCWSSRPTSR